MRGSRANPYTAGVICTKVARDFPAFTNGDDRILTPLRRVGAKGEGRFEPVSWDEALDVVHARVTAVIAAHGPEAVLPLNYAGPHGTLAGGSMDLRFFHKLGASLLDRKPLCGGIRAEAWMGTFGAVPGMRPEQVALSKLVVAWGNNVTWSNLHLMPLINKVRRGGGKLVVVDPVRTKVAEQADLHLALRPGTDLILAWALTAELERRGAFDRALHRAPRGGLRGVHGAGARGDAGRCRAHRGGARRAGAAARGVVPHRCRPRPSAWAMASSATRTAATAAARCSRLPALAGKMGVRGGGLVNGASQAFPKTVARLQRPDLVPAGTRMLNIVDVGAHLLDPDLSPPIKALFIYNHNPVIVHPDQNRMRRGLLREDLFTVGSDVVMTDSMAYCDVVLPASTHFEYHDLYAAYGTHWLQRAEPVIRPRGQSQPNTEIFRRLAARFGFTEAAFTASDAELMDDAMDLADPRLGGVRPSALPTDRALAMTVGGEDAVMFVNVFPKTPSGKIELASTYLHQKYDQRLPSYRPYETPYPLLLVSPASDRRITSTFGNLPSSAGVPPLLMHSDDARARGLRHGMRIKMWNELGEVHLPLAITDAVRPGVVSSLKGAWFKTSDNGQTVSALAPAHHADLAGGACYNDTRVEVAAYRACRRSPPRCRRAR